MLLEFGEDPSECATAAYMSETFDLMRLLDEFGNDIKMNGRCILQ